MKEKDEKVKQFLIITTINPMNAVLEKYAALPDWKLVVVGDRKGPKRIDDDRVIFLDIDTQLSLELDFPGFCPENHYARKNIGYIYAASQGAEIIAETDDDNAPKENWGKDVSFASQNIEVVDGIQYFNVYSVFCDTAVWPRGYPLERILHDGKPRFSTQETHIAVWQHLADNHPDVDAIFRLTRDEPVVFNDRPPLALGKHTYCPFNTQNTFWPRELFPFLYLPITVSMRFTDILRGYVAQRLFWEKDLLLGFGAASVIQERNVHNLLKDFEDEIEMYLQVHRVVEILESVSLSGTPLAWLGQVYEALLNENIVKSQEIIGIEKWQKDLDRFGYQ